MITTKMYGKKWIFPKILIKTLRSNYLEEHRRFIKENWPKIVDKYGSCIVKSKGLE
jgi:hypothetical protein